MKILTEQEFEEFNKRMTDYDRRGVQDVAKQITDGEEYSALLDDLNERYQGYGDQLAEPKAIDVIRTDDGRSFDVVAQRINGGYLVGICLTSAVAMPVTKVRVKQLKAL